ncbi:MAG: hypothetical protein ACREJC_20495 [Tepidisphaeraceae bacterium]
MGVYEGRGQLAKAMKELERRWLDTRGSWDDVRSREFEERFLVTIQSDLRTAVGAMDQMAIMISQARQDCE